MQSKYCTICNTSVIGTVILCPSCGCKKFSDLPLDVSSRHSSPHSNSRFNQPINTSPWYTHNFVVTIGYIILFKIFGLFGTAAGIATYYFVKPKRGHWIALGLSLGVAAVVAVCFLILFSKWINELKT